MKKVFIIVISILYLIVSSQSVLADASIDNGINFLKSKQDSSGKITGFGGESEWASIAFVANSIDISGIKNPTTSLKDFLLSDQPSSSAPATDWERKVLAIVAIGDNPTSFNGINYIQKLEGFYNNSQLGDTILLNDDIFGLLALIAGASTKLQIKQDVLNFILAHQNSDGGFSWSTNPSLNSSDSNDTAASLQALQAAKDNGLTNSNLDIAITNAKNYLLTIQKTDGGFGYDTTSDSDGSSTSWALQALNVLGMNNSTQASNAKIWLLNNQETDGGFHWQSGSGSDTYTTSHSLIALSGKSWILRIFSQSSPSPTPEASASASLTSSSSPIPTPSPTPIATPTPTPIPTPSPTSIPSPTPNPTLTPTSSPSPFFTPAPLPSSAPVPSVTPFYRPNFTKKSLPSVSPSPRPEVLGTNNLDSQPKSDLKVDQKSNVFNPQRILFSALSLINFIGATVLWKVNI